MNSGLSLFSYSVYLLATKKGKKLRVFYRNTHPYLYVSIFLRSQKHAHFYLMDNPNMSGLSEYVYKEILHFVCAIVHIGCIIRGAFKECITCSDIAAL